MRLTAFEPPPPTPMTLIDAPVRIPSSNRNLIDVSIVKFSANVASLLSIIKLTPSLSRKVFETPTSCRENRAPSGAGRRREPGPKRWRTPASQVRAFEQFELPKIPPDYRHGPEDRECLRRVRQIPSAVHRHP